MTNVSSISTTKTVEFNFLQCFGATLFFSPILLTDAEESLLGALLIRLQDYGQVIIPKEMPPALRTTFSGLIEHLRQALGSHIVEAALAASPDAPLGSEPAPAAVMAIWAFEPEGDDPEDEDVLLGSGRLYGSDILIEALRVAGDDDPTPVPAVRHRFQRWLRADGGGRDRAVIRLPGRSGSYVLFAAAAPN